MKESHRRRSSIFMTSTTTVGGVGEREGVGEDWERGRKEEKIGSEEEIGKESEGELGERKESEKEMV